MIESGEGAFSLRGICICVYGVDTYEQIVVMRRGMAWRCMSTYLLHIQSRHCVNCIYDMYIYTHTYKYIYIYIYAYMYK